MWLCVLRVIRLLRFEVVSPIHGLCDRCLRERIGGVVCGRAVTDHHGGWSGHSREVRGDVPLGVGCDAGSYKLIGGTGVCVVREWLWEMWWEGEYFWCGSP